MTSYNAGVSKDNDTRPANARGAPTAWWFYTLRGGTEPHNAARWWVPGSTYVEITSVNANGVWKESFLWEEIHQDPDWVLTDEAAVDAWIAKHRTTG